MPTPVMGSVPGRGLYKFLPLAEARLAGIAAEDIGCTAYGVFAAGDEYMGKTVSIAGEHLTGAQYAAAFADALGEPVDYRPLTHDQLRSLGLPAGDELGNMFQFYVEGPARTPRNQDRFAIPVGTSTRKMPGFTDLLF
jgi:hypothetical protein